MSPLPSDPTFEADPIGRCLECQPKKRRERERDIYRYIHQSEGGGTAPHGIHTSLGALGWGAGCVEDFVVVSVVPGGWVARRLAESPRMLKKSGRPIPYA